MNRTDNCFRHADLIPSYAAGNLAPEQTAGLEAHIGTCAECREELRALTSLCGTMRHYAESDHVAVDRLVAHADGEAEPGSRETIERHLAGCGDCRHDLELLHAVGGSAARSPAGWSKPGWKLGLAAASLLLVGVVAVRFATVQPGSPSVSAISAHVIEAQLRGGTEALTVLRGAGPWLLAVRLPIHAPTGAYRSTVLNEDGHPLPANAPVTVESDRDGFVLLLVATIEPGNYRITFDSLEEPSQETYHSGFRVTAEDE